MRAAPRQRRPRSSPTRASTYAVVDARHGERKQGVQWTSVCECDDATRIDLRVTGGWTGERPAPFATAFALGGPASRRIVEN